jgi:NAD(P)-dependent dehydrogenase (short-subunit alcohol dehydrogenase family)
MNDSKHVLITGGTSGIGLAISHAFLEVGYSVSVCSRSASTKKYLFENQLTRVQLLDMDVTSRESVTSTFANAKSKFGSISVLINNAGQARTETFEKSTLELLTELMSINLHSVYNCSQEVLEDMRAQKFGRIINVSSTAGLIGYSYTSAYCASKHAVIGLSKS